VRNDILIRPARADDIPVMCDLLADLFSLEVDFAPDREKQARGLRLLVEDRSGRSHLAVAVREGIVVGMCSVQTFLSTAEGGPAGVIEDLVVSRKFRGRSTGTRLLEDGITWCRAQGITRLQLLADKGNGQALRFYARRGLSGTSLICLRKHLSIPGS